MELLVGFMKEQKIFNGRNNDFAELFNAATDSDITAKTLKQMMTRWRYDLEALGIYFDNYRNNSTRFMKIKYVSSACDDRVNGDD